jgi:hypothetical protein
MSLVIVKQTKNTCGCPPMDPGLVAQWSMGKKACACGCAGCGSAGCGCGGGAKAAAPAPCTSGTPEATKRPGVPVGACLPPRPRFFPGELVTDADLTAAVDYHRAQQLLANSIVAGWGVYCGFSLCIDQDTCTVCVGPGVAIDAKGRELVNDQSICIARPKPQDVDAKAACDPCAKPADEKLYLAIVYDDCLDSAKPRYGNACGTSADPGCDFSRVRERARFVWVRNLDPSYYTTGCLPDPCAVATNPTEDCNPKYEGCGKGPAPPMDECTPCVGIRGGWGVDIYARALDTRWALSRNVALIAQQSDGQSNCCLGVGNLIDVISGAACEACPGEAIVVLAEVLWSSSTDSVPLLAVAPLRRRVLSNANLTYLVEWLMDYILCSRQATNAQAETDPPPSPYGLCANPCADEQQMISDFATAAAGPKATQPVLVKALAQTAYWVAVQRKTTYATFDQGAFLDVFRATYPDATPEAQSEALRRYYLLVGRVAALPAIDRGIALLFPGGVPADKLAAVEDEVYSFMQRRDYAEVGTASFPAVLALANKINDQILGRGLYAADEAARLAKQFPDAQAGTETELANLRAQMKQLEDELVKLRASGPQAPSTPTTPAAPAPAAPAPPAPVAPPAPPAPPAPAASAPSAPPAPAATTPSAPPAAASTAPPASTTPPSPAPSPPTQSTPPVAGTPPPGAAPSAPPPGGGAVADKPAPEPGAPTPPGGRRKR